MKLDKELVGASSAIIVLSILCKGDTYGYAIIQRVRELSSGKIEWTAGMLYPVLHWLRKHGQIGSRWLASKTGRKRCYYSLRAKGRKTVRDQKQQWKLVSSTLDRLWQTQGPGEMPPRKEIGMTATLVDMADDKAAKGSPNRMAAALLLQNGQLWLYKY